MEKIFTLILVILLAGCTTQNPTPPPAAPAPSVSDQTILNSLQAEVKKRNHTDVTLNAKYVKVVGNWAYVETTGGGDPSINAVLVKVKNKWKLAKPTHPCKPVCPTGMATCADGELICKLSLHHQFKDAPVAIFPNPDAHTRVFN